MAAVIRVAGVATRRLRSAGSTHRHCCGGCNTTAATTAQQQLTDDESARRCDEHTAVTLIASSRSSGKAASGKFVSFESSEPYRFVSESRVWHSLTSTAPVIALVSAAILSRINAHILSHNHTPLPSVSCGLLRCCLPCLHHSAAQAILHDDHSITLIADPSHCLGDSLSRSLTHNPHRHPACLRPTHLLATHLWRVQPWIRCLIWTI